MSYLVTTPPAEEPITLPEMKKHLRVEDFMTEDDDLISGLTSAAREYAEIFCSRAFVSQQVAFVLDLFPGFHGRHSDYGFTPPGHSYRGIAESYFRAGIIHLPMPRLISIEALKYLDTDGVLQTLDPSMYVIDAISEPARVAPARNQVWPIGPVWNRAPVLNAVQINFTCGFGLGGVSVPASVKAAIKLICGHLYENRETILTGTRAQAIELPMSATALLWAHRIVSFP